MNSNNEHLFRLKGEILEIMGAKQEIVNKISDIEKRIDKIDALIKKHNIEKPQSGKRFIVDKTDYAVIVNDTHNYFYSPTYIYPHNCPQDLGSSLWCVAAWIAYKGKYDLFSTVKVWQINKANHLADMLNGLHESD